MKNNKSSNMINESALDAVFVDDIPDDDPRRLLRKLIDSRVNIDSLPPFVLSLDYRSVVASSYNKMQCNLKLYEYQKKNKDVVHAVNTIPCLLQDTDVVVSKGSISYVAENDMVPETASEEEKQKQKVTVTLSTMGIYSFSGTTQLYSVVSTALAYVTDKTETGYDNVFKDERKNDVIGIDKVINAVGIRDIYVTTSKGSNLAREEIYQCMRKDPDLASLVIDRLYGCLPFRNVEERVRKAFEISKRKLNATRKKDKKKEITYIMKGNFPGVFKETYGMSAEPSLNVALSISNIAEQTIGGGETKRGALTSGYMYGEMPSHIVKTTNLVREIVSIANVYGLNVVVVPSNKRYSTSIIRTLVANGISVISDSGTGIQKKDDILAGHYRYTARAVLEIVSDPFTPPTFNKQGPVWLENSKIEREYETFHHQAGGCRVTFTTLSPFLCQKINRKEKIGFLPSLYPHKGKVWLINREIDLKYGYEFHCRRIVLSVWNKVKFPFTRRPFYVSDTFGSFFCESVRLLKVDKVFTDSLKPFRLVRNIVVDGADNTAILNDFYGTVADNTKYEAGFQECAKVRIDHVKKCSTVQDKMKAIESLRCDKSYEGMYEYLMKDPEYITFDSDYETYLLTKDKTNFLKKEKEKNGKEKSEESQDSQDSDSQSVGEENTKLEENDEEAGSEELLQFMMQTSKKLVDLDASKDKK
jgi:hypothetical protein